MKKRFWTPLCLTPLTCTLLTCLALTASPAKSQSIDNAADDGAVLPSPSAIISRDVLVASGDTLLSIAKRELGRTGYAPQLAEFNGLVASAPLIPGNIVRIPIHVPARGEFAQVVFAKGEVIARRAQAEGADSIATAVSTRSVGSLADMLQIPLQRDSEVISGDTITTGVNGYVSIEFSSGSVINLQPGTEATLSRLNCLPGDDSCVIEIRTSRGKVTSDVETRDAQPVDFRISTPYASAAVRGTVFDIDALTNTLKVGVTEGNVDISASAQTVGLNTGFGSVVEEGQPPSDPIALLPAPVFKRVPARVAPGDSVGWWPFSDAEQYDAKVTSDESGNETLAAFDVNEDEVGFDTVESGDYFLHLRAIDTNGLQGFSSNTRITVAAIDEAVTPVDTTVTKQGREFLVTVQDPPVDANGFEIQISSTEAFEDPLSVDVNANGSAVFRLDNDRVFTRARVLLDPYTVSAFGPIASSE